MDAERIALALDGRRDGAGYKAECPVHGGKHLRITDGRERVVFWCFQGATYSEIVQALEERGIWS